MPPGRLEEAFAATMEIDGGAERLRFLDQVGENECPTPVHLDALVLNA